MDIFINPADEPRKVSRRLDLVFVSLHDTIADVENLHRNGWARAWNWSLGQIMDHLNITLRFTFGEIPFFVPFPVCPIVKMCFWPTIVRGKPIRMRGKAPTKLKPRPEPDEGQEVREYVQMVEKHLCPEVDFAPIHPVFGRLDRQSW